MLKQLSFQIINIRFFSQFLLFLSVLVGVSYLPALDLKSNGVEPRNKANYPAPPEARIDNIKKPPVKYAPKGLSGSQQNATAGNKLKHPSNKLRVIKGGEATLGFFNNKGGRLGIQNAYVPRASKNDAYFHYMCRTSGNFGIAWIEAVTGRGACDAVTVSIPKSSTNVKSLSKAQTSQNPVRYCSAVADSGQGWGAVVTNSRWDILSPNDPCKEAVRRCEVNSSSSSCLVVNMGEQDFIELEKEFTAVLKCGNDVPPRQRGNGSVLDSWLNDQASGSLKSSACSLHVLNSEELLVFPTTDQTTVIATGDDIPPFNEPVIVVLAGTVKIVSPNPNVAISERKAQQACYHENPDLLTLGLKQTEGVIRSQQTRDTETCAPVSSDQDFPTNLEPDTRRTTYNSPPIQSFFTGWSANIADDIQGYQNVVEEEFLTPPATPSPTPIQ